MWNQSSAQGGGYFSSQVRYRERRGEEVRRRGGGGERRRGGDDSPLRADDITRAHTQPQTSCNHGPLPLHLHLFIPVFSLPFSPSLSPSAHLSLTLTSHYLPLAHSPPLKTCFFSLPFSASLSLFLPLSTSHIHISASLSVPPSLSPPLPGC